MRRITVPGIGSAATAALVLAVALACGSSQRSDEADDAGGDVLPDRSRTPYDGSGPPPVPRVPVVAELVTKRVDVAALMFAAGEMQISGEPFAQFFAGRSLAGYDRTHLPTDQYLVQTGEEPKAFTDLFGFSTAVESYEYSKYHMNMVAQQTTAGLSLAGGPVLARKMPAATLRDRLRAHSEALFIAGGTDLAGYAKLPAPPDNPLNVLGFQGLWPNFAPFKTFDPTLAPHHEVVQSCTFLAGYGGIPTFNQLTPEFECAYNSLHLPNRDAQVEKIIAPVVIGLATWKEALWSIDFVGRLHDAGSNPVVAVATSDRPRVGTVRNAVQATDPLSAKTGVYLGSTPLEAMWGLHMVSEMDNAAELLLTQLTTSDGVALGGFPSLAAATAYDYDSPLRWFPTAVSVTEDAQLPFPGITSLAVVSAVSRSEDLAALLLGYAMFFGMTDARNAGIGQRIGLELTFDGDPFPADNGVADGEDTPHDRALAVLRVAFVDLDRIHTDPASGVLVDEATIEAGAPKRSNLVSTTSLAHAVIGLRQTLLSLSGSITQYGAPDPDPAADAKGILNTPSIHPIPGDGGAQPSFNARIRAVLTKNASFVRDVLTRPDGSVANGATLSPIPKALAGAASIESQAAAVRALTEGFLVTGDESYRQRARAVSRRMLTAFYSAPLRMFRGVEGGPDEIRMTAARFGWLQSALRETHKVLFLQGDPMLDRVTLEDRVARVNKLFLNGWDDLDGDEHVNLETECLGARLQLGEQALTGELGLSDKGVSTNDRDSDCVLEIDYVQNASVLAGEVFFHAR